MFFDDNEKDDTLLHILCAIARKQKQLLSCVFDWEKRLEIPVEKKTLFGKRKTLNPQYDLYLQELDQLKLQAQNHRKKLGYRSGTFWWTVSWDQLAPYLIFDLYRDPGGNGWRFEREVKTYTMPDHSVVLFFQEEGHCSDFSASRHFETGIISNYSQSEIDSHMRDFNHRANMYDIGVAALAGDARVHSTLSGITYDSAADYLFSAEHYMVRDYHKSQLEKSLFTNTETVTTHVQSQSIHYKAQYLLGSFHLDKGGTLQKIVIKNYEYKNGSGNLPAQIEDLYGQKDAAVECAAYLADDPDVKSVPAELFGRALEQGAVDFPEALRQAELYTILADKLAI